MDEQIAQFVAITGVGSGRAKFFVESAGGDIEAALSTFYEADAAQTTASADEDDEMGEQVGAEPQVAAAAPSTTGPRTLSGEAAPVLPASWGKQAAKSSSASKSGGGFSSGVGRGGIATLRDLRGDAGSAPGGDHDHDDDDEEDDEKKPANFYTGGERSGLSVQNPDRKKTKAPDVVESILEKAKETSKKRAQEGGSSSRRGGAGPASTSSFGGRGRTINDETSQDSPEQGSPAAAPALPQFPPIPAGGITSEYLRALRNMPMGARMPGGGEDDEEWGDDEEGEVAHRTITFWQDGFTIADGPLCRYDDPQHAETLAMINNNRAPHHLLGIKFGQRVEVTVEKKTNEKYKAPPPPPMKPFGGQGNRLGAPVPAMVGDSSSTSTVPMTFSSGASSAPAPATSVPVSSSMTFQVDPSQPTTQIQIRLGDGQRMVAKFNHTHTVGDVRQYINASHPGMSARAYTLQSSFPPKPLTDEAMSIQEAGLINSVVIQKWS